MEKEIERENSWASSDLPGQSKLNLVADFELFNFDNEVPKFGTGLQRIWLVGPWLSSSLRSSSGDYHMDLGDY